MGQDAAGGSYLLGETDPFTFHLSATRTDATGQSIQDVEMQFTDSFVGCVVDGTSTFLSAVQDADFDDHYRNYCNVWSPWTYADTFVSLEVGQVCQTVPAQPEVSCYQPGRL